MRVVRACARPTRRVFCLTSSFWPWSATPSRRLSLGWGLLRFERAVPRSIPQFRSLTQTPDSAKPAAVREREWSRSRDIYPAHTRNE